MKGKVAVMTEPGRLEYQEYDLPQPGYGAVLLEVLRSNVCGSELHIWRGHHPVKKRGGIGHEMVGRVTALGEGVSTDSAGETLSVGDRVVATYFQTCLSCPQCMRGQYNLCDNAYEFFGLQPEDSPHFHTSFSTHIYIHPRQHIYKVHEAIPDSVAASANCALSQVYFGLDKIDLKYGETLVIQGAGGLGLMGVAVARERGARVIIIDSVKQRLEQAKSFGADVVINIDDYPEVTERQNLVKSLTAGEGADVGMEVAGVPAAFNEGVTGLVRRGGRYLVMGNLSPGRTIDFDPGLFTRRAIQVLPVDRYDGRYLFKALQFLENTMDKYPYEKLIDAEFDLCCVEEALDKSASRQVTRASIVIK
ncbi:zinc-binding alcohol dehydrogenase [Marinobacterium nitratireducens]|uniref:Zinc-binding alcohol dehydrogenase n=1 Tax=Marinobacterium nitratireducens TaxID=518897 RepID=A0A918DP44_9GAMM|nr:zinc-binding dehydrogenase [Marinobacterium nitratireducens]GGO76400.1 zinc-binding alcohol dehydrogenase [Marinobacterium nitratireducens]